MSETVTDTTETTQTPEVTETPMEPGKVYDEAYVKELRQEAAKARVDKKEAVEAAVAAAKAEHAAELAARDTSFTELQNELASAKLELDKLKIAIAADVPSDKVLAFAEILKGDDVESLTESAKSSLELFGGVKRQVIGFDPSAGTGGKEPLALNGDGILHAMCNVLGIKP